MNGKFGDEITLFGDDREKKNKTERIEISFVLLAKRKKRCDEQHIPNQNNVIENVKLKWLKNDAC